MYIYRAIGICVSGSVPCANSKVKETTDDKGPGKDYHHYSVVKHGVSGMISIKVCRYSM